MRDILYTVTMSDPNKVKQKDKKALGVASGHTTPAKSKRPFVEVANSSAEEITLLSNQIEEVAVELKTVGQNVSKLMNKTDSIMSKDDMKVFIKLTVQEIMTEINESVELTVETKINEKTKQLREEVDMLRDENDQLKLKLIRLQKSSEAAEKVANLALQKSNYNEQYSRKNNIKIMDVEEETDENESSLLRSVFELFEQQNVTLSPQQVVAIHRIPGKPGSTKPVLMKVKNNNDKTMIMKNRKAMKSGGHRLVDDVTKLNTALITRLNEHPRIDSAWYFNGSVYGKTTAGKRLKFDLHDDIDSVVAKNVEKMQTR